jgi:hypothetical protein
VNYRRTFYARDDFTINGGGGLAFDSPERAIKSRSGMRRSTPMVTIRSRQDLRQSRCVGMAY